MIDLKSLFKKKKKEEKTINLVDIHSHLIPEIDDGAKDGQLSLDLVKSLEQLGYKKLITTPHININHYKNSSDSIKRAYDEFKNNLHKNNIKIKTDYAAEYYVDENFIELIKNKDILTIGDNYVLFEFSYHFKPFNLYDIIYEIQENSYQPILAHPERYIYFHNSFDIYHELKERGVFLQLNINSLSGYYSKPVQKVAKKLVDLGLVSFLGSDTHHKKHIESLKKVFQSKDYKKIFEKNDILNDLFL